MCYASVHCFIVRMDITVNYNCRFTLLTDITALELELVLDSSNMFQVGQLLV